MNVWNIAIGNIAKIKYLINQNKFIKHKNKINFTILIVFFSDIMKYKNKFIYNSLVDHLN